MEIFILMALVVLIVVAAVAMTVAILTYREVLKRRETHLVIDDEIDRRLSMLMQDISKDITEGYVEKLGKQLKHNPELFAQTLNYAAEKEAAVIMMLLDITATDIGRMADRASSMREAGLRAYDGKVRDLFRADAEKLDQQVEERIGHVRALQLRLTNAQQRASRTEPQQ